MIPRSTRQLRAQDVEHLPDDRARRVRVAEEIARVRPGRVVDDRDRLIPGFSDFGHGSAKRDIFVGHKSEKPGRRNAGRV